MNHRLTGLLAGLSSLTILAPLVKSVLVAILGYALVRLGGRVIDGVVFNRMGRRARTIRGMLKSILRFMIAAVVILVILDLLGFETRSVLAGAGILGIIVGFGSQSLIRDVLAGIFILYEDQFNVGDHVTTGGIEGVVEEMGLTVARVRGFSGDLHFIRYGTIDRVTNHSRGKIRALVEIPVSHEEEPQRVTDALAEACRVVAESGAGAVEGPSVLGITALDGRRVVYAVAGKAEPGKQWALEREIRKRVVEVFQRLHIRPPDICYVRPVAGPDAELDTGPDTAHGQAGDGEWTGSK
ncbi:MAG: mechanosensitive ion channel family protein [Ignavibacteriales bacterium]